MKLTLRDLLWLTLLVAGLTFWAVEHSRAAKEVRDLKWKSWLLRPTGDDKPSDEELMLVQATKRMSQIADEQLSCMLTTLLNTKSHDRRFDFEPCLLEMAQRKLVNQLQHHYDQLMAQDSAEDGFQRFPGNLELLTALRRAQGKSDPLKISIKLDNFAGGRKHDGPCVQAVIENLDPEREAVTFADGGDDRGGRRERWQFSLTDERGLKVLKSNYLPMNGGGFFTFGPLEFGTKGRRLNVFDLRKYVASPPSGKYKLEACYHNDLALATRNGLSGLVVSKSDPVSVLVVNHDAPLDKPRFAIPLAPLVLLGAGVFLALAQKISRTPLRSAPAPDQLATIRFAPAVSHRDKCWLALLALIAIGIFLDNWSFTHSKRKWTQRPDEQANWTIKLATKT